MKVLDQNGFKVIRGFLKNPKISDINNEFNYLVSESKKFSQRSARIFGGKNAFIISDAGSSFFKTNLFEISIDIIRKIEDNSQIKYGSLQLSEIFAECYINNPLSWHHDCIENDKPHYRAILYCNPCKAENGSLVVCPQSHKWDLNRNSLPLDKELIFKANNKKYNVEVNIGDLLIFDSKLVHSRNVNKIGNTNREITFEFFSTDHIKRIYSFFIPSFHMSNKVVDNIEIFSSPLKINELNPTDEVSNKLYSYLEILSKKGLFAVEFNIGNMILMTKFYFTWVLKGFLKKIRNLLKKIKI